MSQHPNSIHLTATELLEHYRAQDLKPSEVLAHHFAQIDRVNRADDGGINALTEEMREEASAAADQADARYASGDENLPPLLGIPIVSKEKHAIAGKWVTQGLGKEFGTIAERNQPIIQRVLDAGAILHARTTTPEFSCAVMTHSGEWGVTRNPWNTEATPGGSSGGAGAALAAGMSVLATASDIGGSTRIPSAFSGVTGYKAPYGRVPGAAPLNADWYRGDGPMARSVSDVARLQSVLAGRSPEDHSSWGPKNSDYLEIVERALGTGIRGRRIAYSPTLGDFPVAPSIRENTEALIHRLEASGAIIEEVTPGWTVDEVLDTAFTHFGLIMGRAMLDQVGGDDTRLSPYARAFARLGNDYAQRGTLVDSLRKDARIQSEVARIMSGFDVLLTPTTGVEMFTADENYLDGFDIDGRHFAHYLAGVLTTPFNIANRCPVMAVPTGISRVGVPTSVQVVGHPGDEETVFAISALVEAESPKITYPGKPGD